MTGLAALALIGLLGMGLSAGAGGEAGEKGHLQAAPAYAAPLASVFLPDTAHIPPPPPDSTKAARPPALVPDLADQPTRKSAFYIVAAIAVLSLSTLLLYNVRSR